MHYWFRRFVTAASLVFAGVNAGAQGVPTITAAADLKFAVDEIADALRKQTGKSSSWPTSD